DLGGEEMVVVLQLAEPEDADAGEDSSLVGDAVGQDPVERADPVGGDDQEAAVAEVVDVAHLAPAHGEAVQVGFHQCHDAGPRSDLTPCRGPDCNPTAPAATRPARRPCGGAGRPGKMFHSPTGVRAGACSPRGGWDDVDRQELE